MVFLDANVFLRHLGAPATPVDAERGALARALFAEIRAGHRTATTSEVVLHEVCFALTAPKHYGHPASQVATDVGTLIRYPGFRFPAGELDR